MTVIDITLPWPPTTLSPNARPHFMALAKAKKAYRKACGWQSVAAIGRTVVPAGPLAVHLTFIPPDRRSYDEDNLVARMKAGLDGLADALRVDDRDFRVTHDLQPGPGGMVKVRITEAP